MNDTTTFALLLMLGLEAKHFVADFLLQSVWMIEGKGSLARAGGYVHAGIHAVSSVLVYFLFGLPVAVWATLAVGEFVLHYLLDFSKAHYGDTVSARDRPRAYWGFYGLDQFFHHLTYIGLTYLVVVWTY